MKRVVYKNGTYIDAEVTWEYENDPDWLMTITDLTGFDRLQTHIIETNNNREASEKRVEALEKALEALIKYNKDLCEWLGHDNCKHGVYGDHPCFCIRCELDRAKKALEAKG